MRTAVAANAMPGKPLYVLQLEETVRQLDRLLMEEWPVIWDERPSAHGIETWTAELVISLRHAIPLTDPPHGD